MIKFIKRIWNWFLRLFKRKHIALKPTGSVSLISGRSSEGIEPFYGDLYKRRSILDLNVTKNE